ncbi:MAG: DNA recombination protein RmuC [Acidimicrobiales bacterium]
MTAWLVLGLAVGLLLGLVVGMLVGARRAGASEDDARQVEARLAGTFAELSGRALQQNAEQFLTVAQQRFQQVQEAAQGDLAHRQESIAQLLDPLRQTLEHYEKDLRQLEQDRRGAYEGLSTTVTLLRRSHEQLELQTRNLVTALRAPQTRGRWGEVQLRRVVELAGMVAHCDFEEQVSSTADDGSVVRPDMVVHLPGGGRIVVDSKVPLDAYLRAIGGDDDAGREAAMKDHARQLRVHVDQMAKKEYWRHVDGSAEQVVVFVPDALLAAAFDHDPDIQEHAMAHGVLLATPTTLIALLRTVAYGWRQDTLAADARQVQRLGRELYERLGTMGSHLTRVQRHLNGTVEAFNQAVGSFESRVLVTARRFPDLGAGLASDDLPLLEPVEVTARSPLVPDAPADGVVAPPALD